MTFMKVSALTPNEAYLLHLIRCYVADHAPMEPFRGAHVSELLALAQRQAVTAIVCEQLLRLPDIPEPRAKELERLRLNCIQRDASERAAAEEILGALSKAGIRCMPLKGICLKQFYRRSYHRSMSDIDILTDFSAYKEIREIMETLGYVCEGEVKRNHFNFRRGSQEIEFHEVLLSVDAYGETFSRDAWARTHTISSDGCVFHMNSTQQYLYALLHLLQHYLKGGVGIRFLLDVCLLLKEAPPNDDELLRVLQPLDLVGFERSVRSFSKILRTDRDPNAEELLFVKHLLEGNQYGATTQRAAQEIVRSGSRTKRILRALFEPKSVLLEVYPRLNRTPWLYPLYYPHRICYRLRHRRTQMERRLQAGRIEDERIEQQRELYSVLGILPVINHAAQRRKIDTGGRRRGRTVKE